MISSSSNRDENFDQSEVRTGLLGFIVGGKGGRVCVSGVGHVMVNWCIISGVSLVFIKGMCIKTTKASSQACATRLLINRARE